MSTNTTGPPHPIHGDFRFCEYVNSTCPVEATIYGYYPSLGANAFFCALFALCCIANFILGIRYRTWTYMIALTLGSLAEAIGYGGRIMLHKNPWSTPGFQTQICCLIIAPAFIASGIYLTLKHVVIEFGPQFSRLRPMLYTWIFILCDIFSLVLQAAGGGIAATAHNNYNLQKVGNDLMITGIVFQVVTLLIFGGFVISYALRLSRAARSSNDALPPSAHALMRTSRFALFYAGVTLAYSTVFARCVYRIAEMAKGWKSPIMQNETDFIVLDGVMIAVATLCLTLLHPGYTFPEMQAHSSAAVQNEKAVRKEAEADLEERSPPPAAGTGKKWGVFGRRR